MVEGFYNRNDKCLLVDDVITSGISIMETVEVNVSLYKLKIKSWVMVIIDRLVAVTIQSQLISSNTNSVGSKLQAD